jgi:hypothetical protein
VKSAPGALSLLRFTAAPALYSRPEWWPESFRMHLPTPPRAPCRRIVEACSAALLRRADLRGACDDALHGAARATLLSVPDFERLVMMLGILRRQELVLREVDAVSIREVQTALGLTPLRRLLLEMPASRIRDTANSPVNPGSSFASRLQVEGLRVLGDAAANWSRDVRIRTALRVPRKLALEWRRPGLQSREVAAAAVLQCLDAMESPQWL